MRYPASEKLEIIRTVEGSHLPVKQTLDMLGIPRTTFYRWYDRYVDGGFDALADRSPRPGSVWNRIPDARRDDLIEFALEHEALTTRELAVKYSDEKQYFISESSAYRMLKAADLITAPDYVVIKAADEFTDKTTAINDDVADRLHLLQDHWLGLVLSQHNPGRLQPLHHHLEALHKYAGRRCDRHDRTGADGVGLRPGGCASQATPAQRQRLMLHLRRSGQVVGGSENDACSRRTVPPADPRQNRTLAPDHEEPGSAGKLLPAR